jgi:hypothetical protein
VPIEGITPANEMSQSADHIIILTSALRRKLSADSSLAGFQGSIARKIAGTASYAFAVELTELERFVALQVAREQATINDGPPLVDPSQARACRMLAVSVASLDQGQSADHLLRNLREIEVKFGPAYPFRENGRNLQ